MYRKSVLREEELSDVRDMLEKCRIEIDYESLTSYYDILKVDEYADKKEVTTSFHSLSLQYHPDKHPNATLEMKKYCTKIFQKINTAHKELTKYL